MPNLSEVQQKLREETERLQSEAQNGPPAAADNAFDSVRVQYLRALSEYTGRNVISYYSGWMTLPSHQDTQIRDIDKNYLMAAVHQLDREKGLDLLLHTPGGDIAATESLIDYLRQMFGTNIRAVVPQMAMSGGTMMACACESILMGKQSNLGPIDPQINGVPANGILAEFNEAVSEAQANPASIPIWQTIIGKYHPTLIGACRNAISWSNKITKEWLKTGMFKAITHDDAETKAEDVVKRLTDDQQNHAHNRHIHRDDLRYAGLDIKDLEDDNDLQDRVLTVHHAYMLTFDNMSAAKIIENHLGIGDIRRVAGPV